MKRVLKFALPVVVLLVVASGIVAGVAMAQGGGSPSGETAKGEQFLSFLATRLGISVDDLKADIKGAATDMVDQAEKDGKITPEQANRLRQRIEEGRFTRPFCERGLRGIGASLREVAQSVAGELNLTPQEILSQVKDGKSLAEIASDQGVSREDLRSAITTAVAEQLDEAVSDGKLTQERADEIKTKLDENLDRIIDWKRGAGGDVAPWWGGMPQRQGMHGMRFMWPK